MKQRWSDRTYRELVQKHVVVQMFLPGVVGVNSFKTQFLRVSTPTHSFHRIRAYRLFMLQLGLHCRLAYSLMSRHLASAFLDAMSPCSAVFVVLV